MQTGRLLGCGVAAWMAAVTAMAGELSEPEFVYLHPEKSSFWHTASGNVFKVQVPYPAGAGKASLAVTGLDYSSVTDDITAKEVTVSVPAVTAPKNENVYTLTLTFDNGTALTNRIGVVIGAAEGNEAVTRCVAPKTARGKWARAEGHAVLPIPYGASSLTVDGQAVDTGLGGEQGWYAVRGGAWPYTALGLTVGDTLYEANIGLPGMLLMLK